MNELSHSTACTLVVRTDRLLDLFNAPPLQLARFHLHDKAWIPIQLSVYKWRRRVRNCSLGLLHIAVTLISPSWPAKLMRQDDSTMTSTATTRARSLQLTSSTDPHMSKASVQGRRRDALLLDQRGLGDSPAWPYRRGPTLRLVHTPSLQYKYTQQLNVLTDKLRVLLSNNCCTSVTARARSHKALIHLPQPIAPSNSAT